MQIRRAQTKDIPRIFVLLTQVVNLHHAGRPDLFGNVVKYTDKELRALIKNDKKPIFVAVDDEDVTQGYVFCVYEETKGHHMTPHKTLYIDDLCVDSAQRGAGVGKALYERALAEAKENGCYNVTLHAWALNEHAEDFYRRLGMQTQYTSLETIL